MTAWLWACDHGRDNCLSALVEHGCDTKAVDAEGKDGRAIALSNDPPHASVISWIDSMGKRKSQNSGSGIGKRLRKAAGAYSESDAVITGSGGGDDDGDDDQDEASDWEES